MNDQLLMENYLLILKSTIEVYVHGTLESSNSDVKDLLHLGLDETLKHQEETYNEMTNNGWYKINNVNTKSISQLINKINNN